MPDLGPWFIFILGSDFTFGTSAADQMTPSEPRRSVPLTCVRAFFVCVFLSISLILCLSCAGSALCVRPVCLRLVGKVGRLLISPKNKPYLQAPLKPSVACVHVYLLPHPWGRIPPPPPLRHRTPASYQRPMARVPKVPGPDGPPLVGATVCQLPSSASNLQVHYRSLSVGTKLGEPTKVAFPERINILSLKRFRPRKIGLMARLPA